LAIPLLVGPSTLAALLLLQRTSPADTRSLLIAVTIAWALSGRADADEWRGRIPETMSYYELLLRLAAAVASGAIIGLDRELRRKPAGLRTMALVGLGSAVFILDTIDPSRASYSDSTSRVTQGIVTGIGFLGAGAILRGTGEDTVRGLTTAASIWLAAATGIACGLANWPLVLGSCTLGVLILITSPVERVLHNRRRTDLRIETHPDAH
jgi:putative Mg2+ transporter-C (MgtC) family protein